MRKKQQYLAVIFTSSLEQIPLQQPVGFARHHVGKLQQEYILARVSDGRRKGPHFERLNGQKLIRAVAGNEADPIISGREEGSKSQLLTPLEGT